MSVEHRTPDSPDESGVPHSRLERSARDRSEPTPGPGIAPDDRPAFEHRIERTRLRLQVAALERSLRQSERHKQSLVEQYELVLADREAAATDADSSDDDPLARVKRAIPGLGQ